MIKKSTQKELDSIALCHQTAFANSFSSLLGKKYVAKMMEWYLTSDNKFLIHLEKEGKVVGYCGGFQRKGEIHGSSSGMTQHAFKQGILALILRPWLIFHPKVIANFRFLLRNIINYLSTNQPTINKDMVVKPSLNNKTLTTGLVVIGVDPAFQGRGFGKILIQEFEKQALAIGSKKLTLTVDKKNIIAIKAYEQNGWSKEFENNGQLHMYKLIGED